MIISKSGVSITGLNGGSVIGNHVKFQDDSFTDIWIEVTTLVRLLDIVKHSYKDKYDSFIEALFKKEKENV